MTIEELLKQSRTDNSSKSYSSVEDLLSASKATSTPSSQRQATSITPTETPVPVNKSSALSFLKTGFNKITDRIADTKYFREVGEGLSAMEAEGKTSAAEMILKPASFGVGNLENIPLGVGEVIKQGRAYVKDQDPYLKNVTFGDWLNGMKETGQAFAGSIVSGATEAPSLLTAGTYAPEIKFNIPGIGEVSNSDYKIADRVSKGEDPNLVVLSEKTTGFMNALFFIGIASKPFLSRPMVVAKGKVNNASYQEWAKTNTKGVEILKTVDMKQPIKSFRLYEQPTFNTLLSPQVLDRIVKEEGIVLGKNYNPKLPTFFRMTGQSNGKIVTEVVQLKPSYFSIFKDKLSKAPPRGITVLTSKETSVAQTENAKPTQLPVVPPVTAPVSTYNQPITSPQPALPKAEV